VLGNMQVVGVFVTRISRTTPTDLLHAAAPPHPKRLCWRVVQMSVELLRLILLVVQMSVELLRLILLVVQMSLELLRLILLIVQMSVELLRLILLSDNSSRTFTCGPPLVSARISNIIY